MISLLITIVMIIIVIALNLFTFFMKAFTERITLVNSCVIGAACGICLYLCNRSFNVSFFSGQIHPAICAVIGFAIILLTFFLQKTKVGFWIFAAIFSAVWAFVSAAIVYIFITQDMTWIWVVCIISFIMNIFSHIRSKEDTQLVL